MLIIAKKCFMFPKFKMVNEIPKAINQEFLPVLKCIAVETTEKTTHTMFIVICTLVDQIGVPKLGRRETKLPIDRMIRLNGERTIEPIK
jgi:hypothetical protein